MYTPKGDLNDKLLELVQDSERKALLTGNETLEEGYEKVKEEIPGLTLEEFRENMKIMNAYLEESESENWTLNEEELDSVAGGKSSGGSGGGLSGVRDCAYRPEDAWRDAMKRWTQILGGL